MIAEQPNCPLGEAFDAMRRMDVPERPADADLLARMAASTSPAAEPMPFFKRRTLMRVMIWSAAAAVLVAVSAVLVFNGSATVALADVIKAAEKHKLVKYKMTQTDDMKAGGGIVPLVQVAYADLKAPRFRLESKSIGSLDGAIDFESIFVTDGSKNVRLHTIAEVITEKGKTDPQLISRLKDFAKFGIPRKEATLHAAAGDFTPATAMLSKSILENLRELEDHKDAVATRGKLIGKDVVTYRIEEEFTTTLLTVDAATKLPVKLEYELTDPKVLHPTVVKMSYVLSDFEWDADLQGKTMDELFNTTPPEGFTVKDMRKKEDGNQGQ